MFFFAPLMFVFVSAVFVSYKRSGQCYSACMSTIQKNSFADPLSGHLSSATLPGLWPCFVRSAWQERKVFLGIAHFGE